MEERTSDVADFIARSLGHSIHDSIEKAWLKGKDRALRLMGYPDSVIEQVQVNPTQEALRASNSIIPVYVEQRLFRKITVNGVTYEIGGKFDMVSDGIIQDFKSTSAWAFAKGTKDDDYSLQMSIYRWLDAGQDYRKILDDFGRINFIFTDWSKAMLRSPGYPQKRVEHKDISLISLDQTEKWIHDKLALVQRYIDSPEADLPECTDEELWRSDPQYKYFSDPAKASVPGARSTKNFDSLADARKYMAEKGGKGIVVTKPGEVKACGYCAAYDACSQKDQYFSDIN
jgi:hypothetical protein